MNIATIIAAKNHTQVFPELASWKTVYRDLMKDLHPDVCREPGASDAVARLNQFKDQIENGREHKDEAGTLCYYPDKVVTTDINTPVMKRSLQNIKTLLDLKGEAADNFRPYLPPKVGTISPDADWCYVSLPETAVPLSALHYPVPQAHVNWITSRMMELASWLSQTGWSHAGFNPDSVYVVPRTHGIILVSAYHMTRLGQKLSTVNGNYMQFYPAHVLKDKTASPDIDVEMIKRTAIWMLGDKSGAGTVLRKAGHVNQRLLDFFLTYTPLPLDAYKTYREILKGEFKSEFVPLEDF